MFHYDGLFVVDGIAVAVGCNGIDDVDGEIVAAIVEMSAYQPINDDGHASNRQHVAARFANSALMVAAMSEHLNLHYDDVENGDEVIDEWLGVYEQ